MKVKKEKKNLMPFICLRTFHRFLGKKKVFLASGADSESNMHEVPLKPSKFSQAASVVRKTGERSICET